MAKIKLYVVFSKEGADAVLNGDLAEVKKFFDLCLYEFEDCVKIREFETEGERDAYLRALDDFNGFMDFAALNPTCSFDKEIINEIEKRYA